MRDPVLELPVGIQGILISLVATLLQADSSRRIWCPVTDPIGVCSHPLTFRFRHVLEGVPNLMIENILGRFLSCQNHPGTMLWLMSKHSFRPSCFE